MRKYNYYWYHHMAMTPNDIKEVKESIENKNYFKFIELYKLYTLKAIQYGKFNEEFNSWIPMIFLPDTISVWDGDNFIEYLNILNKDNFEKITFNECECG